MRFHGYVYLRACVRPALARACLLRAVCTDAVAHRPTRLKSRAVPQRIAHTPEHPEIRSPMRAAVQVRSPARARGTGAQEYSRKERPGGQRGGLAASPEFGEDKAAKAHLASWLERVRAPACGRHAVPRHAHAWILPCVGGMAKP